MVQRLINISEILEFLPHRYPMLLVDRILEMGEDRRSCRGLKNVTFNEPFFQGHYPGNPIMPGVLIVESMAQVASVLLLSDPEWQGKTPLIGALDNVKFKRIVRPGDQLITDCEVIWFRNSIGKIRTVSTVDGELAASMEMIFKLRSKDE